MQDRPLEAGFTTIRDVGSRDHSIFALKDAIGALWAISVDPAADSKGFSEKIAKDGQGPIGFPLLADPESRTIDAYGMRDPRYAKIRRDGIPSPTTYVIDRKGRVAWVRIDRDHTRRPSNGEIRAAFEALK